MRGADRGFLLLTSQLGESGRKPLTTAQFRELAKRVAASDRENTLRDLEVKDLMALGYDRAMAERIYGLLAGENTLRQYLQRGDSLDCYPITRLDPCYPVAVRRRMGLDSPGVLWAKGDVTLLNRPAVAVIGSRDLREENLRFAREAGRQIAAQGFVLVSGNARGADQAAQDACLEAGGCIISVVADELWKKPLQNRGLYLALEDFDQRFSTPRALQRNHVIHSLADLTVAAQCTLGKGGTWDGILTNLKKGWSPVCVFSDGSEGAEELQNRGVLPLGVCDLSNLQNFLGQTNFIDD